MRMKRMASSPSLSAGSSGRWDSREIVAGLTPMIRARSFCVSSSSSAARRAERVSTSPAAAVRASGRSGCVFINCNNSTP